MGAQRGKNKLLIFWSQGGLDSNSGNKVLTAFTKYVAQGRLLNVLAWISPSMATLQDWGGTMIFIWEKKTPVTSYTQIQLLLAIIIKIIEIFVSLP